MKNCDHDICTYIIANADSKLIECFRRIAVNILHKKLQVPKSRLKRLLKYKKELITLAKKSNSGRKKKRALQTGGFVGTLVSAVATLLPAIISLARGK